MNTPTPVLFVSHGAPTFALDPGLAGAQLNRLGRSLARPMAILIVSPHWMTRSAISISAGPAPETIHDFGGFPSALYTLSYPAPGAPPLARRVAALLEASGKTTQLDANRGLDHGAWVPLLHLYPDADIPVIQVSLPMPSSTQDAFALGQALRPLREEGVLIIGSGSLTHNLYEFRAHHGADEAYVAQFAQWTEQALQAHELQTLLAYRQHAPNAARAHPTEEHLLPLFVALGAADEDYALSVIEGGIAHGVLAMDSYCFQSAVA